MKTQLQLSIATDLKERLRTLSEKSHIKMAGLVDIILRDHLQEYEARYERSLPSSPPADIPKRAA